MELILLKYANQQKNSRNQKIIAQAKNAKKCRPKSANFQNNGLFTVVFTIVSS